MDEERSDFVVTNDAQTQPSGRPRMAGRLCVVAAAVMWSSSGLFAKARIFDDWPLESRGLVLAFWRALFAGLLLLPLVRGARWNWRLLPMTASFALMNAAYLTAMTLTTAANAIWLQSTAPLWIFVFAALWGVEKRGQAPRFASNLRDSDRPLGASPRFSTGAEATSRRDWLPLVCGLLGVTVILGFELTSQTPAAGGILCGLTAGLCYAGVVLSIRALRGENAAWLVALNHLVAAAVLAPYAWHVGLRPSATQLLVLAGFGLLQMGLPYLLFARGLRSTSSQEASLIALLEPVLMPVWVYLAWGETPAWWTLAGGGLILLGLLVRYGRATR